METQTWASTHFGFAQGQNSLSQKAIAICGWINEKRCRTKRETFFGCGRHWNQCWMVSESHFTDPKLCPTQDWQLTWLSTPMTCTLKISHAVLCLMQGQWNQQPVPGHRDSVCGSSWQPWWAIWGSKPGKTWLALFETWPSLAHVKSHKELVLSATFNLHNGKTGCNNLRLVILPNQCRHRPNSHSRKQSKCVFIGAQMMLFLTCKKLTQLSIFKSMAQNSSQIHPFNIDPFSQCLCSHVFVCNLPTCVWHSFQLHKPHDHSLDDFVQWQVCAVCILWVCCPQKQQMTLVLGIFSLLNSQSLCLAKIWFSGFLFSCLIWNACFCEWCLWEMSKHSVGWQVHPVQHSFDFCATNFQCWWWKCHFWTAGATEKFRIDQCQCFAFKKNIWKVDCPCVSKQHQWQMTMLWMTPKAQTICISSTVVAIIIVLALDALVLLLHSWFSLDARVDILLSVSVPLSMHLPLWSLPHAWLNNNRLHAWVTFSHFWN